MNRHSGGGCFPPTTVNFYAQHFPAYPPTSGLIAPPPHAVAPNKLNYPTHAHHIIPVQYRPRPSSVGRPKHHRRSLAVLQDLHRYFQPPQQQTLPVNPSAYPSHVQLHHRNAQPSQFDANCLQHYGYAVRPQEMSVSGTLPHQRKPAKSPQRPVTSGAFPTDGSFSTLPKMTKTTTFDNKTDEPKKDLFKWFKPRKVDVQTERRQYTSGSLPRNFSLRNHGCTPKPTAPLQRTSRSVNKVGGQLLLRQNQSLGPQTVYTQIAQGKSRNSMACSESESFYDNTSIPCSGNLNPTCGSQGTLSRRRVSRYDVINHTVEPKGLIRSGEQRRKSIADPASSPPPEPAPDYSGGETSPTPPPRVRFRDPSPSEPVAPVAEQVQPVPQPKGLFARTFDLKIYKKLKPLIQIRGIKVDEKDIKKEERRPSLSTQPQKSTVKARNEHVKAANLSKLTEAVRETLKNTQTDQPKLKDVMNKSAAVLLGGHETKTKKRRAPDPPPLIPNESYTEISRPQFDFRTDTIDEDIFTSQHHYVNLEPARPPKAPKTGSPSADINEKTATRVLENSADQQYAEAENPPPTHIEEQQVDKRQMEAGVCYIGATRVEYRFDLTRGPSNLVVHYETRQTSPKKRMGNLACIGAAHACGGFADESSYVNTELSICSLPQKGVITDLAYGPGIVQRLRERFSRLANTSADGSVLDESAEPAATVVVEPGRRRFSSVEPQRHNNSAQKLPFIENSRSVTECPNSASSTGYSSEESSAHSDAPVVNSDANSLASSNDLRIENHRLQEGLDLTPLSRRDLREADTNLPVNDNEQASGHYENTSTSTPIRSLREKFENKAAAAAINSSNRSVRTIYSPRSISCHTSVVARYPDPRKPAQVPPKPLQRSPNSLKYNALQSATSSKAMPDDLYQKRNPEPARRPLAQCFATEFRVNGQSRILPSRSNFDEQENTLPINCTTSSNSKHGDSVKTARVETSTKESSHPDQPSPESSAASDSAHSVDSNPQEYYSFDGPADNTSNVDDLDDTLRAPVIFFEPQDEQSNLNHPNRSFMSLQPPNSHIQESGDMFGSVLSLDAAALKKEKAMKKRSTSLVSLSQFFARLMCCKSPGGSKISRPRTLHKSAVPYSKGSKRTSTCILQTSQRPPTHFQTSDDLESIVSHEDEYSLPPALNATYIRTPNSPRPTLTPPRPTPKFQNSATSMEQPREAPLITCGSLMSDVSHHERSSLTLPINDSKSTIETAESSSLLKGQPGNTPTSEMPTCKKNALKDSTAMVEVHKLLNKFNAKRFNDASPPHTYSPAGTKVSSAKIEKGGDTSNSHGMNSSGESFATACSTPPRSVGQTSAVPPSTPRKSLSARYLESKNSSPASSTTTPVSSPATSSQPTTPPRGPPSDHWDNTPEPVSMRHEIIQPLPENPDTSFFNKSQSFYQRMDDTASTTSEDSLEVDDGSQSMFGDQGGPVRASLLHLVPEEDIPELLEAMTEELHFTFDDYQANMPSTSGIIQKRQSNTLTTKRVGGARQQRICFTDEPPRVFAYLDETSALAEGEWRAGQHISYAEYQKIIQDSVDESQQQMTQLARWRQTMQMKYAEQEEALDAAVEQMNQAAFAACAAVMPNGSPLEGSRTPTPIREAQHCPTPLAAPSFPYTSGASVTARRQECGTSAI